MSLELVRLFEVEKEVADLRARLAASEAERGRLVQRQESQDEMNAELERLRGELLARGADKTMRCVAEAALAESKAEAERWPRALSRIAAALVVAKATIAEKERALAAAQAREAKLCEALAHVEQKTGVGPPLRPDLKATTADVYYSMLVELHYHAKRALALPAAHSALVEVCERVARDVAIECGVEYGCGLDESECKAIVARVLGGAAK